MGVLAALAAIDVALATPAGLTFLGAAEGAVFADAIQTIKEHHQKEADAKAAQPGRDEGATAKA